MTSRHYIPVPSNRLFTQKLQSEVFPNNTVTWKYAWYTVMGGFVVDVSPIHDRYTKMTITHWGIWELAKRGLFLPMEDDAIQDKAKATYLAKSIVICQLLYLVVDCIGRAAEGLPLTLLEIHTLVHVVCAGALYIAWWEKPFDVTEPTSIDAYVWNNPVEEEAKRWKSCIANLLMCCAWLESWKSPDVHREETWPEMRFCMDISFLNERDERDISSSPSRVTVYSYDTSGIDVETAGQEFHPTGQNSSDASQVPCIIQIQTGQAIVEGISVAWSRVRLRIPHTKAAMIPRDICRTMTPSIRSRCISPRMPSDAGISVWSAKSGSSLAKPSLENPTLSSLLPSRRGAGKTNRITSHISNHADGTSHQCLTTIPYLPQDFPRW